MIDTDTRSQIEKELQGCLLTAGISPPNIQRLAHASTLKVYSTGDTLWYAGDKPEHIYLLLNGGIRFDLEVIDGESHFLGIITDHDICGDIETFTHTRSLGRASVFKDSRCLLINSQIFLQVLEQEPVMAIRVLSRFSTISKVYQQLILLQKTQNLDTQLASFLINFPKDEKGYLLLQFSQEELAKIMGVTRQSISKVITQWKNNRWISYANKKILILNTQALENFLPDGIKLFI